MASALLIAVLVSCITTLQCFNEKGEAPTPRFLTRDTNVTVFEGSNVLLPCAVQHLGTSQVLWRHTSSPSPLTIGSMAFTSDARISVHHKRHSPEWNLHIRHVSTKDGGLFTCQISKSGQSRNVLLTVQDIKISGPSYVEKGNALRLVCNATGVGYPPDRIDWFKDGHKITQDDRLHIQIVMSIVERTIISSLYIKRAKMTDAGTYVCRTSDLQITSTKVFILNISFRDDEETGTITHHTYSITHLTYPIVTMEGTNVTFLCSTLPWLQVHSM
ncbi:hemicentin-2-like isoform X2 [Haliotis rufescens]|uniref:hemicentin-2-like isoform X2 n=1 Tax=Haliotis rufescens TaxID=6454 RepID=UPI00201EFCBE|nr:hemicentin-2-like isoform X2 [Haliotis rufescens]